MTVSALLFGSESSPDPSLLVIRLVPVALAFSLTVLTLGVAVGALLVGLGTLMTSALTSVASSLSV